MQSLIPAKLKVQTQKHIQLSGGPYYNNDGIKDTPSFQSLAFDAKKGANKRTKDYSQENIGNEPPKNELQHNAS